MAVSPEQSYYHVTDQSERYPNDRFLETNNIQLDSLDIPERHLAEVLSFIEDFNVGWRKELERLFDVYAEERRPISDDIRRFFLESETFCLPEYRITSFSQAQSLEEELAYQPVRGVVPTEDSFCLLFNLPKPLSQYWIKNSRFNYTKRSPRGRVGNYALGREKTNDIIEWYWFYVKFRDYFWSFVKSYCDEPNGLFMFDRLNRRGDHCARSDQARSRDSLRKKHDVCVSELPPGLVPAEFYYVLRVTERSVDQEELIVPDSLDSGEFPTLEQDPPSLTQHLLGEQEKRLALVRQRLHDFES